MTEPNKNTDCIILNLFRMSSFPWSSLYNNYNPIKLLFPASTAFVRQRLSVMQFGNLIVKLPFILAAHAHQVRRHCYSIVWVYGLAGFDYIAANFEESVKTAQKHDQRCGPTPRRKDLLKTTRTRRAILYIALSYIRFVCLCVDHRDTALSPRGFQHWQTRAGGL